jgi:hypothetical protein
MVTIPPVNMVMTGGWFIIVFNHIIKMLIQTKAKFLSGHNNGDLP